MFSRHVDDNLYSIFRGNAENSDDKLWWICRYEESGWLAFYKVANADGLPPTDGWMINNGVEPAPKLVPKRAAPMNHGKSFRVDCVVDSAARDEFTCAICLGIINDALSTGCGHVFCRECLLTSLKRDQRCPIDRQHIMEHYPAPFIDRKVMSLETRCICANVGCDWRGTVKKLYDNAEGHLGACEFLEDECRYCGEKFQRRLLKEHEETDCPEAKMDCPFAQYGCKVRPLIRELRNHLEEALINHLTLKLDCLETQVRRDTVPSGCVMAFAGENIPPGWLHCDGSRLDRNMFPDLFAAVGTRYSEAFHSQAGSGPSIAEDTFRLPDYRGSILMGASAHTEVAFQRGIPVMGQFSHAQDYRTVRYIIKT